MLIPLYRSVLSLATPLLEAHLNRRAAAGREDPARIGERRGNPLRPRPKGPLVWVHGASLGESISLLALVRRLLQDYPGLSVMMTTGTVSSAKIMAERLPEGAFHQFMPLDHPLWVASFLDHWKPDFAVWVESEIWPAMLTEIKRRGIPAALFNARMSPRSFGKWKHAKGTVSELLSVFKVILAQNPAEESRYRALNAPNLRLSVNLKYAAAPLPFDSGVLETMKAATAGRPLILFASTHGGEEEIALRLHKRLKAKYPCLLTFLLPRHNVRAKDVLALCAREGVSAALRSECPVPAKDHDVHISDTMGEIGMFYRLSKLIVVGGSFVDVGGHNPIEPAQLGAVVFYGPVMYNFTGICQDFESRKAALPLKDEEDLFVQASAFLENPESFAAQAKAAQEWTASTLHVIDDLSKELAALLPPAVTALKKAAAA